MRDPQDIKIGKFTLKEILERHLEYLQDFSKKDMRADLNNTNLINANLHGANLCRANLRNINLAGADLQGADLYAADLRNADLHEANLQGADLQCAILYYTNFYKANLCNANLRDTPLYCTNLSSANLKGANLWAAILCNSNLFNANLQDADLTDSDLRCANLLYANVSAANGNLTEYRRGKILTENLIGYKKCKDEVIVTLEIPRGAIVFSINGNKCRTNKAKVISIDGADRAYSTYQYMSYYVGDEITVYDFNCEYNIECAQGIHFYMTRYEAEDEEYRVYNL